ncbi:MAG: PKD domain-containing protein, partial [Myxococcaceae bacterium]
TAASLAAGRSFHTATLLPDGTVLVCGGGTATCERYNPTTNVWAAAASLSAAPARSTATVLPDGRVLATLGGTTTAQIYTPGTNTWSAALTMPNSHDEHTATLLSNGTVAIVGRLPNGALIATLYDYLRNVWSTVTGATAARAAHAAALLPNGRVLLVGGMGASGSVANVDLLDEGRNALPAAVPALASVSVPSGGTVTLTGTGFLGRNTGGGGNWLSSQPNYPLLLLRDLESDQTVIAPTTNWTATSATATLPSGLAYGSYRATVVVNSVPSSSVPWSNAGGASRLAFSTSSRTFSVSTCSGTANVVTVQLRDDSGNPVNATAGGRSFTLTSSSGGTVTWWTDNGCTTPVAGGTFTIPSGSSSVNIYYRDTQVGYPMFTITNGTGLTNPAPQQQAVLTAGFIEDDFESTGLLTTDNPAGEWSQFGTIQSGNSVTSSAAAAHRGARGLRMIDTNGGSGALVEGEMNFLAGGVTGNVYARHWFRITSSNNLGVFLFSGLSYPGPTPNVLSMRIVNPGGALSVETQSQTGGTVQNSTPASLSLGTWYLVEYAMLGMGTASGTARVWLNGVPVANITGLNWNGWAVDRVKTGQFFSSDRRYVGDLDYDDWRTSPNPLASTVAVATAGAGPYTQADCVPLTVSLRDSGSAALAPAPYAVSVGLSSSVGTDVFHSDSGCSAAVTSVTVPTGSNSATVYLKPGTTGSRTLSVQYTDFLPGSTPLSISSGASRLAFTTPVRSFTAGACGGAAQVITVELQDTGGTAVPANAGGQAFTASSNSTGTVTWFTDATCSTTASGANFTIAAGASSANVYYRDTRAGTPTITLGNMSGLTNPTGQQHTVVAAAANRLAFGTQPSSALAGAALSPVVTVRVEDSFGNLVTSSTAPVALALSANPTGATLSGTQTVNAISGVATFSDLSLNRSGNGFTLGATAAGLTPATSPPFNVSGAGPTRLAFTTPARSVVAGNCSAIITVAVQDGAGNLATLGSALPLTVGGAQLYSDAACTAALGTVGFGPGNATVSFYLSGAQVGTYIVSASSSGLTGATQQETILAGPPASLEVSGFPSPVMAGESHLVTVTASDALGNRVEGFVGPLSFSSTDSTATLPTGMNMGSGDLGQVSASAALRTRGLQTLTVTSGALTGAQTGIDVVAGPPSRFILSGIPSPIPIERWADATLEARDAFGNRATGYAGVVHLTSTDVFAALPNAVSITAAMQGLTTLPSAVRFRTAGTHDVVATDASNPLLNGAQTGIVVTASSPPLIAHDANLKAAVGQPYRYNALGRVETEGELPMQFESCGAPNAFNVDRNTGAVSWKPDTAGSISVCIKAINTSGDDSYTFNVDVQSRAPTPVTAAFTATPDSGPAPLDARLDPSATTAAPDALPLLFQWDFGDGSPLVGEDFPMHHYAIPGGFRVRLDAFDAFGAWDDADGFVRIQGAGGTQPPTARIVAQGTPTVALSCDCTAGNTPIVAYLWETGVGAPQTGPTTAVTYSPGTYTVRLTVVDANGLTATDTLLVSVNDGDRAPPRCWAGAAPPAGDVPLSTVWTGVAAPGSAAIVRQEWTVDGQTTPGTTVKATYTQGGTRQGRFLAEDANGLLCVSAVWVTATVAGQVPPRIMTVPSGAATCAEAYSYVPHTSGDKTTEWTLISAPSEMTVNPTTGELSWMPSSTVSSGEVVLRATNAAGTTEQTFNLEGTCQPNMALRVGCGCGSSAPTEAALMSGLVLMALLRLRRVARRDISRGHGAAEAEREEL